MPVQKQFWNSKDNQRKFVDWLVEELQIRTQEDWYHVSIQDVIAKGGAGFVYQVAAKSHIAALKELYPQYLWPFQYKGTSFDSSVQA
jgi:hypothetical protein